MRIVGHGIDLVEISRIELMLIHHGRQFIERCFSEAEQAYAEAAPKRRAERYAARFAAKEAAMKALGTGWSNGVGWRDIAVERQPDGLPMLVVTGRCAELAAQLQIKEWQVSLSHTGTMAMASVIASG